MKELRKNISSANIDYKLIEDNDHIAVGFSGGMDSFALVLGLDLLKRYAPINFTFDVYYMDMGFDGMDISKSAAWCESLGYPLHIIPTNIVKILKQHPQANNDYSCSICSKLKKGYFIDYIKTTHANKVAFAHHGDDAIETLFLNMVYGGKLATFKPKMYLTRQNITFIRPLVYVRKSTIATYKDMYQWPVCESTCPNNFNTQRDEIRKLVERFYQTHNLAKHNFLKMLYNDKHVDLWTPLLQENKNK
jgi:tRNA 2-thiocytidine biosynthesis protein TtcA